MRWGGRCRELDGWSGEGEREGKMCVEGPGGRCVIQGGTCDLEIKEIEGGGYALEADRGCV